MSAELINIDFKQKRIISRGPTEPPPKAKWEAKKDPEFKEWMGNLAYVAEMMVNELDGDWRNLVAVFFDGHAGENGQCLTIWDNTRQTDDQAMVALSVSLLRLQGQKETLEVQEMPPPPAEPAE